MSSTYINQPSKFPYVYAFQASKSTNKNYVSTSRIDHAEDLLFEVEIFSNKANTAKTQCKDIASVIEESMYNIGFSLDMQSFVPNDDEAITRLVQRYSGTVRRAYGGENNKFIANP